MMVIGPLEYVVIGFEDHQFTREILPELNAIQQKGAIRVVDLLFVQKDADGTVRAREVNELNEQELHSYGGIVDDLMELFTAEDIEKLAEGIPPGTSAVVVLLEHTWALGLTEAVRRADGVLFTGGMVTPEALAQVGAELAAKEGNYA
jgi:uncharacterized membrane protein